MASLFITAKLAMKFIRCLFVSLMRFLRRIKFCSQIFAFPRNFNPRTPFPGGFYFGYSFITRSIGGRHFSVRAILSSVTFSQIIGAIIGRVAINMVNNFSWPFPGNKKPSQSLGVIQTVINTDAMIPMRMNTPSLFPFLRFSGATFFPYKFSRFWIIIQKVKNELCCNLIFHNSIMSYQMTFVK